MADDVRTRFMAGIAKLTAPDRAAEAAEALVAMLPMLADVPPRCWSSRTCLDAVAVVRKHGVPSYAEVRQAFNGWMRENPDHAAITTDATGLDDAGRRWVAYYRRRAGEGFRPIAEGAMGGEAHVLSLIKAQHQAAWAEITGQSAFRAAPTDAEREAVVAAVGAWRAERQQPAQA